MTAKEFVVWVQGTPIQGYTDAEVRDKAKWMQCGRGLMRKLAKELGLQSHEYKVRTNPAGPACSGDIHLHADWVYVALEQSCMPGVFMWRYCDGQKDYTGRNNQWVRWEILLDLPAFAKMIRDGRPR